MMKLWGSVLLVASLGLAAPAPSAANGETTITLNTVSVSGVGRVPISQTANAVEANDTYHQALVQAVDDGRLKAGLLATEAGARLASIDAISEGTEDVSCKEPGGEEFRGEGLYKGAEPDVGSVQQPVVGLGAPGVPLRRPVPPRPKKKPKKRTRLISRAHAASVVTCELNAHLTVVYGLERL